MVNRIAHQATAFGLAAVFTLSILSSINVLAVQPAERTLMAAEQAASQVAQSVPANTTHKHAGG